MEKGDVKEKNGRLSVHRTVGRGGEEVTKDEMIEVRTFETNPATVSVERGMTINMGNYQSLKIGVFVSIPCYIEEIPDGIVKAARIAEEEIDRQVKAVKSGK